VHEKVGELTGTPSPCFAWATGDGALDSTQQWARHMSAHE
jgi:hypothetical protein